MSPSRGFSYSSRTTTQSPGKIPTPVMESPTTLRMNRPCSGPTTSLGSGTRPSADSSGRIGSRSNLARERHPGNPRRARLPRFHTGLRGLLGRVLTGPQQPYRPRRPVFVAQETLCLQLPKVMQNAGRAFQAHRLGDLAVARRAAVSRRVLLDNPQDLAPSTGQDDAWAELLAVRQRASAWVIITSVRWNPPACSSDERATRVWVRILNYHTIKFPFRAEASKADFHIA